MKRREVLFAVIGGVVGAVLVMAAGSIAPRGAQNELKDAKFGEIICSTLQVKGEEGLPGVFITVDSRGGHISVGGKHDKMGDNKRVVIRTDEHGGRITVMREGLFLEGGSYKWGKVVIGNNEHGGMVDIFGKGSSRTIRAAISVNKHGNGAINTWDKNGNHLATLK